MQHKYTWKEDTRPKMRAWAPGKYMCNCWTCKMPFIGDKRAMSCADCAYGEISK